MRESSYIWLKNHLEMYYCDEEEVTPGCQITYDLGLDSLDVVALVMKIEHYYDIVIPDSKFFDDKKLTVERLAEITDEILANDVLIIDDVSPVNYKIILPIAFGVIMFLIALLDVDLNDANSINEMSLWGKVAVLLFFAPFVYWIYELARHIVKKW